MISLFLSSFFNTAQISCVEEAVFFESRGEPLQGQMYVANVIQNRASHKGFPNDYCSVVHQKHQFTYRVDKKKYEEEPKAKLKAKFVAYSSQILPRLLPENVVYYTANRVKYFEGKRGIQPYSTLGGHTFYQEVRVNG